VRRFLVLALLAGVLLAMPAAGAVAPPDGDGSVSDCELHNVWPPQSGTRGWGFVGTRLAQGDAITMSVGEPATGSLTDVVFVVDGLGTVDSAPFPGTVSWTVPSTGIWTFRVTTLPLDVDGYGTGFATYDFTCTPATPPPPPPGCFGVPSTIVGTGGDDVLVGTTGPDVISGLGGNDTIRGLGGDDLICGGNGDDLLAGGGGDDRLRGGDGDDTLLGRWGDDFLGGGAGADRANGGLGTDVCWTEAETACE